MGYSDRNNRSGGRNFGGGRGFDRPSMHKATCDSCGKTCEVPFRPTGSKPVFCRDCFAQNGGADSRSEPRRSTPYPSASSYNSRPNRDNDSRRSGEERTMYGAICDKCGKNCKIPFEPTSGRPVFCSNCFETNGQTRTTHAELNYKKQFEELNAKMDKILALLTPESASNAAEANIVDSEVINTENEAVASNEMEEVESTSNVADANSIEEEVQKDATSDVAVEKSKDSGEPKKKPKTKATLAAKKKRESKKTSKKKK